MNQITLNDVIVVAADLIVKNGSTTTLDVKNELRTRGFKAFQIEVSKFMDAACVSENWEINDNGIYRTYADRNTSSPTKIKPATTGTASSMIKGNVGDWEVNSVTDKTVIILGGHLTRDAVRSAYAKATGAKFADTRARKIK